VKPLASLSLDLDNEWSYLKTHGDPAWEALPSYLGIAVDEALSLFAEQDLRITFFVVGQDAAVPENGEALARIPAARHEVGNHSFHHDPWLHLYAPDAIEAEIARAEESIEAATGVCPRGFRGPGYSVTETVLEVLYRRGYRYDASSLPTFLGPVARAYYLLTSDLDRAERKRRRALFGSLRDGFRPLRAHRLTLADGDLLEIPVTTLPVARVPFHLSYVLWLSTFSAAIARTYFRGALAACRAAGVEPSLLLHPLDVLGGDEVASLRFFPAMQVSGAVKRERVRGYLADLGEKFRVVPLGEYAEEVLARGDLARLPVAGLGSEAGS
jgi:hypothetical protein